MCVHVTLQHSATRCNTRQHTATHNNTLQHAATHCKNASSHCTTLHHTATHRNTLHTQKHTARHSNTLQHAATHLQHTATDGGSGSDKIRQVRYIKLKGSKPAAKQSFVLSAMSKNINCSALQSVLQCVAVRCCVLQCVAVCCSLLQYITVCCSVSKTGAKQSSVLSLMSRDGSCTVLQSVAVLCSALQCVATCQKRAPNRILSRRR